MRRSPGLLANGLLTLAFLLAAPAAPAFAADPNPSLTARVQGVRAAEAERRLEIAKLAIDVRLHGTIAETEMTIVFANPSDEVLEGDFAFAMPAGSVVTGYALDVGGAMLDGVLIDQYQARQAYEARVRAGIDPGLAEVARDNVFRTRIFPIMRRSTRTIRLRFSTPLDPAHGYALPLTDAGRVGDFSLDIRATGMDGPPRLTLPAGVGGRWEQDGAGHRLAASARDTAIGGTLALGARRPSAPLLVSRHAGEGDFFQILDGVPSAARDSRDVRRVRLYWDRSLSRADDKLTEEIALVRAWLERTRPEKIEIILFDSSGVERVQASDGAEAAERLRSVRYRGGTSLAVLAGEAKGAAADSCLLFTDGLVTIDRRDGFRADCPLFAVSSAADADRAWLGAFARGNGGEAIDLASRSVDEALTRITRRVPRVVDVRSTGGAPVDFALLDGGETGWRIVGPMPESGDVLVRLSGAGAGAGITERVYSAGAGPAVENAGPAALWAADRVAVRAASDDVDRDALVAFSRRYSVASPTISFVVLETAADYARSAIEPPAGFAKEQRAAYDSMRRDIEAREAQAKEQRLGQVLALWDEQQAWWKRRFDPNARPPKEKKSDRQMEPEPMPVPVSAPEAPPPPPAPLPPPPPAARAESGDVLVTGSRIPQGNLESAAPVAAADSAESAGQRSAVTIVAPWALDRPYLAALDAAPEPRREAVFAEQQEKHGALPAFWLDVAEWHFQKGRRAEALAALLSALELPTRNSQTLSIVADRLVRYGEPDRAIFLLERLVDAERGRPQPKRTLALALAERAESNGRTKEQRRDDLARAISLLTEVITTPWASAYDGIELISLMEVNRLIPLHKALGGDAVPLDPRLVALLDVDLRIVIEWNSEATDIDLWVDEPNGERAIYSHPRTLIGGRLSNDMTSGFGPEEYLLRRAPAGTFTIRAHVYAADRLNPNGASNVTAKLIRDFGRPTQSEEVVDIELLPEESARERLIGRIRFNR